MAKQVLTGLVGWRGMVGSVLLERMRAEGDFALIEPVFQAYGIRATGTYSLWVALYVGAHVLVINIIGLWLFRRHGFILMYLFRMIYYFLWHILWGHLRLSILFQ
ncbi:MAG TPA: hypothetical protein PK573_14620 [Spirochaetota bacterium]|nr:hypothetical protein [Spirochaetota bacterium]